MPSRTRFNPTANGPLHVGHLYLALVNQEEAHRTGGTFTVRIEDNQEFWLWKCGLDLNRQYCDGIRRDLEWAGVEADAYTLQSETHEDIQDALKFFLRGREFDPERRVGYRAPEVHGMYGNVFFPYAPYLTIEKALEDVLGSVNLLIRGIDLLSENAFYEYCCDILRVLPPRMVYMPRLIMQSGQQMSPLSKTAGNCKIQDFRDKGYQPDDVIDLLRQSCMVDRNGSWLIDNIKDSPVWVG